ncbi:MAG: glycosyltransferase family 4 protein [Thermoanaerobaculia bacterium]
MRIIQLLEFNQFNTGSVHQMFQAASGLRERGHEVTIVSRPGSVLAQRAAEADVDFVGLLMRNEFDLPSAWRLARLFARLRPDVVHVHKGVAHSLAMMASLRHPVGAFVVNRGVSFPLDVWNRPKFRTRRVDRVVTVCEQIRGVVIVSGKLPPTKVEVVYAGTDVHRFDPASWNPRLFRREKGIADDRFLIVQVGVRDWKGWKELIDAVALLLPEIPSIHLAFVGCRHEREFGEVRAYAQERGIAHAVTPVETRDDMPAVFASADLVVDASWAGTGITGTIREAMSMARPVIATDCGGNGELVSSADVGWLIAAKEVAALVAAIRGVIQNPDGRRRIGESARAHVIQGFSKDLRIARLETLYAAIRSERQRSG